MTRKNLGLIALILALMAASKAVWDHVTQSKIRSLHPSIQADVTAFINDLEKNHGIKARIYSGFRSIEDQNKLYAQGRTEPGKKVTNVKGGESFHNYGLAFDLVEIDGGSALWNNPNWDLIGRVGKNYGFDWGGDWISFVDKPHFQRTFGYSTSELAALPHLGQYPQVT